MLEMTEFKVLEMEEMQEDMRRAWSIQRQDLVYVASNNANDNVAPSKLRTILRCRFGHIIGVGGFGTVYEGFWGHIKVAIKVLRTPIDELDEKTADEFQREITFMESIRHPHLLSFFGAGRDDDGRAFLVTELMERGSLQTLLERNLRLEIEQGQMPLDWNLRLSFALDTAKGMIYLHQQVCQMRQSCGVFRTLTFAAQGAVHRDLKADNCFVDAQMRVKIADFGTGRFRRSIGEKRADESPMSPLFGSPASRPSTASPNVSGRNSPVQRGITAACGSLLWMPPESLLEDLIEPEMVYKIDVYAFGVLMFELWSRRLPWDEIEVQGVHFPEELKRRVCGGHRPMLPTEHCKDAPQGYARLMHWCWSGDPADRPTFAVIGEQLTQLQGRINPRAAIYE